MKRNTFLKSLGLLAAGIVSGAKGKNVVDEQIGENQKLASELKSEKIPYEPVHEDFIYTEADGKMKRYFISCNSTDFQ